MLGLRDPLPAGAELMLKVRKRGRLTSATD